MVKLVRESRVATDLYFAQVLRELRAEGVRINQDNTITGHFLYNDDFKVFQIIILDRKVVTVTNKKFQLLGYTLRSEFRNYNTHAHISAVSDVEVDSLDEIAFQKIRREYQEVQCRVRLVGLVVFSSGSNRVAGLEVRVHGLNDIRFELGLNPLMVPHISTRFKRGWVGNKPSWRLRGRAMRYH